MLLPFFVTITVMIVFSSIMLSISLRIVVYVNFKPSKLSNLPASSTFHCGSFWPDWPLLRTMAEHHEEAGC